MFFVRSLPAFTRQPHRLGDIRRSTTTNPRLLNAAKSPLFGEDVQGDKYTEGFRNPTLFRVLPAYLQERFARQERVDILNYACSKGYEPLSLAVTLTDWLGEEVARKFNIIASDMTPSLHQTTGAQGVLEVDPVVVEYVKSKTFKSRMENFMDPIPGKPGLYQVKPSVRNLVTFRSEPVDILESLRCARLSQPCVVMVRNCWYLLTPGQRTQLARLLYQKLPKGSVVVIGFEEGRENVDAMGLLKKAGFEESENPTLVEGAVGLVYEKN